MAKRTTTNTAAGRTFDAIPDTLDFRDRMFEPTLIEVPTQIDLLHYRQWNVPILNQGNEGACTGFGLATIANYLLRRRRVVPDENQVSPRMFYEMAKRYDEWPGEDYDGSSARGAMKGWHKHGICTEELWKYDPKKPDRNLTDQRARDAAGRPLGAYYRVNHKDLVSMHSALVEVGILYATSVVHEGWGKVGKDGIVPYSPNRLGGHAFAIVAYDREGFWIQNSWSDTWGMAGFARVSYDDWLHNGTDVWVAQLGVPVALRSPESTAVSISAGAGKSDAYAFCTLRSHIISVGNNGQLRTGGAYGTSESDIREIFEETIPTVMETWTKRRLLLYAHGGLTAEDAAVQRVADYRGTLLDSEVYPLAFIWKTDYWSTLTNIIEDALGKRKPEGFLDSTKDFMLDRLDDALEPIARGLTGKSQWDEMKENGLMATTSSSGGARIVLKYLDALIKRYPDLEIHIAGHSAGSIFMAPLVSALASSGRIEQGPMKGKKGLGRTITTCTLWAPACTIALFKDTYLPVIQSGGLERFGLFTLTDRAEQDDHCAHIYHKSLLYLVSSAFEDRPRIPLLRDGEPILGMAKFVAEDTDLKKLFRSARATWVLSPNDAPEKSPGHATSRSHGDFDDDLATLHSTFMRITNGPITVRTSMVMHRSIEGLRDKRRQLR